MKELRNRKPHDWVTIGCHQRDVLFLLRYCPVPLPLKKITNLLSSEDTSSPSYFQIWRSLTKLAQKGLAQRVDKKGYVITAKGLQHFDKRRNLIMSHPLLLERDEASLNTGGCV